MKVSSISLQPRVAGITSLAEFAAVVNAHHPGKGVFTPSNAREAITYKQRFIRERLASVGARRHVHVGAPRVVGIVKLRPRERRDGSRRHSTRGSTDDDPGGSEPPPDGLRDIGGVLGRYLAEMVAEVSR